MPHLGEGTLWKQLHRGYQSFNFPTDELKQPVVANALNQIMALELYRGHLYAFQGNEGIIHRFNGDKWTPIYHVPHVGHVNECWGHAVYNDKLIFCGSYDVNGRLWVYDGKTVTVPFAPVGEIIAGIKEFRDTLYIITGAGSGRSLYKTTDLRNFTLITTRPPAEVDWFQPGMAVFHDRLYWGGDAPLGAACPVYQMTPAEAVSVVHNLAGIPSTYGVKEYSYWLLIACGGGNGVRLRGESGVLTDPGLVTPGMIGEDGLVSYNGVQYAGEATTLYMGRATGIRAGVVWTCVQRGHATPTMAIWRGKLVAGGGVDRSASDKGAAFATIFDEPPTDAVPDVWQWWNGNTIATEGETTRGFPCYGIHEKTVAIISNQAGTLDIEADFDGNGVYHVIVSASAIAANILKATIVYENVAAIRITFTPDVQAVVSAWITTSPP